MGVFAGAVGEQPPGPERLATRRQVSNDDAQANDQGQATLGAFCAAAFFRTEASQWQVNEDRRSAACTIQSPEPNKLEKGAKEGKEEARTG